MKKKDMKKLGALVIGATLAVTCIASPIAVAEEVSAETEVTTAIVQQMESETTILNDSQKVVMVPKSTSELTTAPAQEVDKSELFELYELYKDYMRIIQPSWVYPEDSYEILIDAFVNVEKVLNNDSATQEEVDAAIAEFNHAGNKALMTDEGLIGFIRMTIDKDKKEFADGDLFTAESWEVYVDARDTVAALLADSNASPSSIFQAAYAYSFAKTGLEPLSEIEVMRVKAGKLLQAAGEAVSEADKYTKESLDAVEAAVPALKSALDNESNLEELSAAYNVLDEAVKALEKIEEPTTEKSTTGEEPTTEEPTTEEEPTTKKQTTEEFTTKGPTTKPSTDNPKTSDDRNLFPIGLAGSVSLAVMGAMVLLKKKKAGEN